MSSSGQWAVDVPVPFPICRGAGTVQTQPLAVSAAAFTDSIVLGKFCCAVV